MRTAVLNLILLAAALVFTLLIAELVLRVYYFRGLAVTPASYEARFWRYDPNLGWSPMPETSGQFVNAHAGFSGRVTYNRNGIRVNDNGYEDFDGTLLVIGDSFTAGLEVDNHETFGAILERRLHDAGCRIRVVNAGVRGYGSDQAY